MSTGLRWRVLVLQVGLVGIFAFAAGMLLWGGNFSQSTIRSQLSDQQITFPAANSPAIKALPAADAAAMGVYAGQALTTGPQAETYADHFIAVHLEEIGGGKTYSQFPATGLTPAQTATKTTLFQGETLRGLLLNAYGWWTVGSVAIYGGIGMAVASFAVLVALIFELYRWRVQHRAGASRPFEARHSRTDLAA